MKKLAEMNGNEKIAYKNIKKAFGYNTASWVNCIYDGCPDWIPETEEEAKEYVYDEALNNDYRRSGCIAYDRAPKEMRFAGKEFITEVLEYLWDKDEDGDVAMLAEEKGWWN